MRLAVAMCCAALTACGSDPPLTGPVGYQALHYDYAFDLDSRAAAMAVTLLVTQGGDCIDIPLRAGGLTGLALDGELVGGSIADGMLHACGAGWPEGTEVVLSASVAVALDTWETDSEVSQVGFSRTLDLDGNVFEYLVSWIG